MSSVAAAQKALSLLRGEVGRRNGSPMALALIMESIRGGEARRHDLTPIELKR